MNQVVSLTEWIQQLSSGAPTQRIAAATHLARLGTGAQVAAIPLIAACAANGETASWAAEALESLGPPALTDAHALAEMLTSESEESAYWAATLLGRLGPSAAACVAALARALAPSRPLSVRQRAAWALGKIGGAARSAQPTLQSLMHESDARLARLAQEALAQIDP